MDNKNISVLKPSQGRSPVKPGEVNNKDCGFDAWLDYGPWRPGCKHATLFETILGIEVDRPPSISQGEMEGAKSFYNVVSELVNLGFPWRVSIAFSTIQVIFKGSKKI